MKYVVIELYTDDIMNINEYDTPYCILGIYDNKEIALQKMKNEVAFQVCDIDDECAWNSKESKYLKDECRKIIGGKDLYYYQDYQYSILVEELKF